MYTVQVIWDIMSVNNLVKLHLCNNHRLFWLSFLFGGCPIGGL